MGETIRAVFGPGQAQQAAEELASRLIQDDLPTDESALMRHLEDAAASQRPDLSAYECSAVAFRAARLLKSREAEAHPSFGKPLEQVAAARDPFPEGITGRSPSGPRQDHRGDDSVMTGASLRAQRLALGLSTADIAARAGLAPHQIIQFEAGVRTLPADIVSRLVTALSGPDETPLSSTKAAAPTNEPDAAALYALYRRLPKGVRRQVVALMKSMIAEL